VAREDSDGDGVDNETELLLGHNPGDSRDTPSKKELADARRLRTEFANFLASYRWRPFEPVKRPEVPLLGQSKSISPFPIRNPIDAFIAAGQNGQKLNPRPRQRRKHCCAGSISI